jgi:tRNA(Arg) A34 adenosine deaminase TadA
MRDEQIALLRETMTLAEEAFRRGDHPFGALLVVDGAPIMSAGNSVVSDGDPTRHAELSLMSQASRRLPVGRLAAATLYSSTEPCPMCAGAIQQCGISSLVYGCSGQGLRELMGRRGTIPCREIFARAGRSVDVVGPLLEDEGIALHRRLRWWATEPHRV